jgi:hypothetical protein
MIAENVRRRVVAMLVCRRDNSGGDEGNRRAGVDHSIDSGRLPILERNV